MSPSGRAPTRGSDLLHWGLRLAWVSLPFTAGPALAAALDPRSRPVQLVASTGLWLAWVAALLALLVPRPVGLTLLRVVAPAVVAAAIAAVVTGEASTVAGAAALVVALVVAAAALAPATGERFVGGAAYGDEVRLLLRAPGALLVGPLYLAWALLVASVVTGPLLLAARAWVAGALAVVIGAALAVVLARALHSLTRRWVVFVPAGMVLKDHLALADPVLFRRGEVEVLQPAPADTDALDLTMRSPGLALELRLDEEVPIVRVVPGAAAQPGRARRLLFTPTRPGAVLTEARRRRLRVG